MLFQQSFERIHWAFCDFEFSRSQLIHFHEKKNGTREKSPDNQIVRIIEVRLYFIFFFLIGVGCLFEAGSLLTFPTYTSRVGAYSRLGAN